jgi:predicted Fe-Mo cluster-binding NifX family protein
MKYAVPVSNGMLSQHFGHCEHFAIFEVDGKSKKITGKKLVASPAHQPGLLPEWLARQGVAAVIAGGMGLRAQDIFQQNGISVVLGAIESDPEKAVLSHINGTLAIGDNVCDH